MRLGREVARFNRIAKYTGLDMQYNLSELRGNILSRKELERTIKSLKRLSVENAPKYKESELKIEIKQAERTLKKMLKKAPTNEYVKSDERMIIEGELRNIQELDKLSPWFKRKKIERIKELAKADYELRISENYRKWYMDSLRDYYSNFRGYDKLTKKLSRITNAENFYNRIKENINESDIYYLRYGTASQEQFNKILKAWGLEEYGAEYEEVHGRF